jgi:hypothetical protein
MGANNYHLGDGSFPILTIFFLLILIKNIVRIERLSPPK